MRTAIVIVAHGSRLKEANQDLFEMVRRLGSVGRWELVEPSFLQFEEPNLAQALEKVIRQGAEKVVIVPLLLFSGNHMQRDIPKEIKSLQAKYPGVRLVCTRHLGMDDRISQMVIERIEEVAPGEDRKGRGGLGPKEIEEESFSIIEGIVDLSPFPEEARPIIKRVIHTTGDPDFARTLLFHPGAINSGIRAIREGRPILTDVGMVKAGIDKRLLARFCSKVICKISSPSIIKEAEASGKTRASVAVRSLAPKLSGGIVAIGNAPTALVETVRLVREGKTNPALIVAVPVGFVWAQESKAELEALTLPYITNSGRKGGSTVAVAIVNALLRMAAEDRPWVG